MHGLHDVETVRAAETALRARLPAGSLMARAAAGLARECARLLPRVYGARIALLVGSGDNGGDALLAGALLARRGARVEAVLAGSSAHADGLTALRDAGGRVSPADVLDNADLVLDGLVGIGGRGPLREAMVPLAHAVAESPGRVVAVDVPSGVDADSGGVEGTAVRAELTVTFGTRKPGLVVSPGAAYAGRVVLVDIGLAPELPDPALGLLEPGDVARLLPRPAWEASKYSRGVLGVVAGSDAYPGAAVLCAGGAARAGAGMVRFAGVAHPAELVRSRWPEALVTVVPPSRSGSVRAVDDVLAAGRVQAWAIGPGIGTGPESAAVVEGLLATDLPVLLDADAVTCVADHHDWLSARTAPTLLTPHAGEFARLTGADREEVEARRLPLALAAARDLGVTVLLKGSTTIVADPQGAARVNPTGTPWLGTAGSGDVLTGACGALLAGGLSALDAGAVGAYLHGRSGQLASYDGRVPVVADDLVAHWQRAVASLSG